MPSNIQISLSHKSFLTVVLLKSGLNLGLLIALIGMSFKTLLPDRFSTLYSFLIIYLLEKVDSLSCGLPTL